MRGFLLTENAAVRWSDAFTRTGARLFAANLAVGALAGLLTAHGRLGLAMPGHKALLWLTPILVARLLARHPLGATGGATLACCTCFLVGGNLGGGFMLLPLVMLAGGLLDVAVRACRRWSLPVWLSVPLLTAAGAAANVICAAKRLGIGSGRMRAVWGLTGPWAQIVSYALFGAVAAIIAVSAAAGLREVVRPRQARPGD